MKDIIKDFWVWYGVIIFIIAGIINSITKSLLSGAIFGIYFLLTIFYVIQYHRLYWVTKFIKFVKNEKQ